MDVGKWSEATRPAVTAVVVVTFCLVTCFLVWTHAAKMNADQALTIIVAFVGFATTICQYWFKERSDSKASEQAAQQVVNTVAAVKALGTGTGQPGA
jgi:cytochrome bd-type quinol oxidase subunit 2